MAAVSREGHDAKRSHLDWTVVGFNRVWVALLGGCLPRGLRYEHLHHFLDFRAAAVEGRGDTARDGMAPGYHKTWVPPDGTATRFHAATFASTVAALRSGL